MIKSIIVDDESYARSYLKQLLLENFSNVLVIAEADSVRAADELITKHQPDLVFLDIEMPLENGFKLLEKRKDPNFQVVFTTAYDQYAIKAIKYSALDYLLKPINVSDLNDTISRVMAAKSMKMNQARFELLLSNMGNSSIQFNKVAIPSGDGYVMIKLNDIVYCEADGNYTKVFTIINDKLLVSKTLGWFENLLPEELFFRIHKSYIVNLNLIKKYNKLEGQVLMENNKLLDVADRLKKVFLEKLVDK